jgi:biopolymer transport protein ExbD
MAKSNRGRWSVDYEDPTLDIASLIDVSFLLLIYFLVTSTMQPREGDLNARFPAVNPNPENEVKIDHLQLTLMEDGTILGGVANAKEELAPAGTNRNVPKLVQKLKDYEQVVTLSGGEPLVIVTAEDQAKTQRFVDILNALAEVGIVNLTMTGFRPDE